MKALKTIIKVIFALALGTPMIASAQYYTSHDVYYGNQCQNLPQNMIGGATAGGIVGGLFGAVFGNGRTGATLTGIGVGVGVGALLGAGFSCQQAGSYYGQFDAYMMHSGAEGSFCSNNMCFMTVREGYDSNNNLCRTFHSEIRGPNGNWVPVYQTGCWVNGGWRYNYPDNVYSGNYWSRPQLTVVEMQQRFPVLYSQYTYRNVNPNYGNQYWVRPAPTLVRPVPVPTLVRPVGGVYYISPSVGAGAAF